MKASELRIGNYVFTPELNGVFEKTNKVTKLTIVESVDSVGINFFQSGTENEYDHWDGEFEKETIKPIPITEKWLTDFGFKSKDYDLELGYIKWSRDKSSYGCEFIESNFFIVPNGDDDYYRIPIDIKYVHQLQNLYFGLTGKELELK